MTTSKERYRALVVAVHARNDYARTQWGTVLPREDLTDEKFKVLQEDVLRLAALTLKDRDNDP